MAKKAGAGSLESVYGPMNNLKTSSVLSVHPSRTYPWTPNVVGSQLLYFDLILICIYIMCHRPIVKMPLGREVKRWQGYDQRHNIINAMCLQEKHDYMSK